MIRGGVRYYFAKDQLGSIRVVINADTGAVAQAIHYDEFGRVLADSNPGFQPFGFAGGHFDHETGLVRFGARDYDAEVGRWLNKDPILFAGGDTNLYEYVLNNPVNFVDPEGETAKRPGQVMEDIAGGGGGGRSAAGPSGVPARFFSNVTVSRLREILTNKFGAPRSTRPGAETYYNPNTRRSYNVHWDPRHGPPHVDIRRRGGFEERNYPICGD